MEKIIKKQYGNISLINILADSPGEWDVSDATHVRVSLPSDIQHMIDMQKKGYQFVDRMLDVSINLKRVNTDLNKLIRIKPEVVSGDKDEIKELALRSFTKDRRFHVEVAYSEDVAGKILNGWIDEISEFFVCKYKDSIIGFLALKEEEDGKSASIHLAAVDERYRASGAAMSLYANAVLQGIEKGYQSITGYISSENTAVLNLYSYLGGVFSNPQEIYLKCR